MTSTVTPEAQPIGSISGPFRRTRVLVPAGEYSPWILVNAIASVVCAPGTSMKAQATLSPLSIVQADNAAGLTTGVGQAIPFDWTSGTVSAVTSEQVRNATAVRFQAVAGNGVGEIAT